MSNRSALFLFFAVASMARGVAAEPAPPPVAPTQVLQPPLQRAPRLAPEQARLKAVNFGTSNRIDANADYVGYGKRDRFLTSEASFTHYFYDQLLHSIRFGAGALIGETPHDPEMRLENIDSVRFYYAMISMDSHLTEWLGTELEVKLGMNNEGIGGGATGALRFGPADGFHGRIGGELCSYIGHRAFIGFQIPVSARLRIRPEVAIENLPRASDGGFRARLEAAYRVSRTLELIARIGAAARDAQQGSVTGGVGVALYY